MANSFFQFKTFRIDQDKTAMKVTTEACLLGAWAGRLIGEHLHQLRSESSQTSAHQPQASGFSEEIVSPDINPAALDIGTGTGLLALMLTQATGLPVDAVELEGNAAAQAAGNFSASPWKQRLNIVNMDIREYQPAGRYRYIISNPPFYEKDLRSGIHAKNLAHHDEGLSLDELISCIKKLLAPDGQFYLLLPLKRHRHLLELLAQNQLVAQRIDVVRQTSNHEAFRMLICGSAAKQALLPASTDNTVTGGDYAIKDTNQQYTPWFTDLLSPYYLHL